MALSLETCKGTTSSNVPLDFEPCAFILSIISANGHTAFLVEKGTIRFEGCSLDNMTNNVIIEGNVVRERLELNTNWSKTIYDIAAEDDVLGVFHIDSPCQTMMDYTVGDTRMTHDIIFPTKSCFFGVDL